MKNVVYTGASTSPLVHLRLKKSAGERNDNEQALQDIIDTLRTKHRIIAVRSKYVQHEKFLPAPSIRFVISANHTKEEIESAIAAIDAAAAN
jgi:7-keto-8-aminopelargonate synthetase-like enzyme